MIGELRGQRAMGAVGFGGDHDTGRVLVEPMHDAGPTLAADAGQAVAAMGDQRVDQGSAGVAGGGMNDKSARLVDDDHRVVFEKNIERDGFAGGLRRFRARERRR